MGRPKTRFVAQISAPFGLNKSLVATEYQYDYANNDKPPVYHYIAYAHHHLGYSGKLLSGLCYLFGNLWNYHSCKNDDRPMHATITITG